MVDWNGNEIKVGQTIVIVSTKDMFEGAKTCLMLIDRNGNSTILKEELVKKSYLFNKESRYIITEPSNNMTISLNNEPSEVPINHIDFWVCKQYWQIICIEGVSDNKDKYYKHYFNL